MNKPLTTRQLQWRFALAFALNVACALAFLELGKTTGKAGVEIPRLLGYGSLAAVTIGSCIGLIRTKNPHCQVAGLCGLVAPGIILYGVLLEGLHYW